MRDMVTIAMMSELLNQHPVGMHRSVEKGNHPQPRIPLGMRPTVGLVHSSYHRKKSHPSRMKHRWSRGLFRNRPRYEMIRAEACLGLSQGLFHFCILQSAFCILHSAICILHSAFCILQSAFCILHSAICILHSAFCILHSAFCILHSAFCIYHFCIITDTANPSFDY